MGHRIEYFRGGKIIGARVSDASLEAAKTTTVDEMAKHDADFVRLIDLDGSHAEVWSTRREAA